MPSIIKTAAVLCLVAAGGAQAQTVQSPAAGTRPMGGAAMPMTPTTPSAPTMPMSTTTPMSTTPMTTTPMTSASPVGTPMPMTTPSTTTPSTGPAAVTTLAPPRTGQPPAPGANSFTEGQARSRIADRGFSNVADLKKDAQGIWRGTAQKNGKPVTVALDFEGNVQSR